MKLYRWILVFLFLITPSSALTINNSNFTITTGITNYSFASNQTLESLSIDGTELDLSLNGTAFSFGGTSPNITLSNITANASHDNLTFTATATSGAMYINRTNGIYKNANYQFKVDGVVTNTKTSPADGNFGFVYSGWSTHTFSILTQLSRVVLTAVTAGYAGNFITTTETVGNASYGAVALRGGSDGSQWNSDVNPDMPSASGFWDTVGGVMKVAAVVIIIGGFLSMLRGGSDKPVIMDGGYISDRPRSTTNMQGLIVMAIGIFTLIIAFTIIPLVGSELDSAIDIPGVTRATGTLTFTNNVKDNELVNISNYTFEFNTDGTIIPAYIPVNVSTSSDGMIDQTNAILNLTLAIQNNASTNGLVTAVDS